MSPTPASGVEREIKIPVADLAAVRDALVAHGAELVAARALERNRVWERADGSDELLASGRLLRLREDGQGARLTYKGVARFEGAAKVREEREVAVASAGEAAAILGGLGYRVVTRYEKFRETWRLDGALVALDETPIGDFVEIERDAAAASDAAISPPSDETGEPLAEVARRLGLDLDAAETRSYLALYQAWRAERPHAPRDMVFASESPASGREAADERPSDFAETRER